MAKKKSDEARQTNVLPFPVNEVPKNYIPDGFESVEAFLEDMREEYDRDISADHDNRHEAIDDKRFAAGEQWDAKVLEYRKGLPCLTLNTVPQFTAQLVGDWRQNRNAIKVLPAEDGDVDVASIRSDLIRAIETKSRANRVYDSAFESVVQCGDGAFRVSVEYAKEDVFDQEIYVRPIDDALSVVWDRMSVDPTGRDARHCFVDDMLPISEFKAKWGNEDYSTLAENTKDALRVGSWMTEDEARVTEYWRLIERDKQVVLFEDGFVTTLDPEQMNFDELFQAHGRPVKVRTSPCTYAQMHLVTGYKILAGPYEYKMTRLPIIRMTGRIVNIAGRKIRYGLVRFMKDAVRLRNFWRSVAAEQLGYAPKAQWMATETAVEGREDAIRKAHLSRDPLLVFNDEAEFGRNVERLDPPVPQMALLNEAQVNAQDLKDITGLHDASLGIKSNETSGKAILARQREGDTASLTYYDNGNAAILEAGDVINQLISQIYDGTRTIRIIGEDEMPKLMKINDPMDPKSPNLGTGNYDVVLSTGANFTTRRVEAAEAMMNAIQVYPELMQVAGDLVVKAQDWPGAQELSERLKKTIPPQFLSEEEKQESGIQEGAGIDPAQMAEMQDEMQKMQQENAEMKLQLQNKMEEQKINWYKAETDRIKALSDHEVDANKIEMDALAKILDHDQSEKDREHAVNEAQADRDQAVDEAQKDRDQSVSESDKDRQVTRETAKAKQSQPKGNTK